MGCRTARAGPPASRLRVPVHFERLSSARRPTQAAAMMTAQAAIMKTKADVFMDHSLTIWIALAAISEP